MHYKLILLFSSIGLLMGLLSVAGLTQGIEPFLWLIVGIITAWVVSRKVVRQFLHGFLIGLAWGTLNGIVQSLFFDTYMENNPHLRPDLESIPFISARLFVLAMGPVIGLLTGAVVGGMRWGAGKVKGRGERGRIDDRREKRQERIAKSED